MSVHQIYLLGILCVQASFFASNEACKGALSHTVAMQENRERDVDLMLSEALNKKTSNFSEQLEDNF